MTLGHILCILEYILYFHSGLFAFLFVLTAIASDLVKHSGCLCLTVCTHVWLVVLWGQIFKTPIASISL